MGDFHPHQTVQNSYGTPRKSRRESGEAMPARSSEWPQKGRRRSSTELFEDLLANLRKQSLQGVLNSRRKVGIGTCVHHLT
uniref:Uncharacterized protein n=1 Tax=Tanacetum cinerariifolium TaxID=118510 RepID=A0A699S1H8_TANCI|nr:hypothetical protein [Tanacetum cinerariifolium]